MKIAILILTIVLATTLCSCYKQVEVENSSIIGEIAITHVVHFEYKNHEYIRFINRNTPYISGYVHDPDCKYCKKPQ